MNSIEEGHICRAPRWLTLGNHQKGFSFFMSSIKEERQLGFFEREERQEAFFF